MLLHSAASIEVDNAFLSSLGHGRMPEMKPYCLKKQKAYQLLRHGNCQKVFARYTSVLLFLSILLQRTYGAVPDVQKHLLSLLWPTDYIRKAGSFLRCHTVVWKSTLESCTLHTYNKKTSCLQGQQKEQLNKCVHTALPSQHTQPLCDTEANLMSGFHLAL